MGLKNRGKEGRDDLLFGAPKMQAKMQDAITDVSYLLSRGYSEKSSVQLAGNRYKLNARQQHAVQGMSASETQISQRRKTQLSADQLKGQTVVIDGFNLIIILESFLSNAYVFKGLDSCYRDLSSVHGTYKRVQQTATVLTLVGDFLKEAQVNEVVWILDQPVSNSGRMKTMMGTLSRKHDYPWNILLDYNPDKFIAQSDHVGITSDAWILDRVQRWFNLGEALIKQTQHKNSSIIKSPSLP